MLPYKSPQTSLEAKFSVQFCLAIAILEREVGIKQFTDEKVLHPNTQDLMKKISLGAEPSMQGKDYMPGCVIEIRLKDGKSHRFVVEIPVGSPKKRLTLIQLREKYRSCCRLALPEKRIEESLRILEDLENVQDISVLFQALVPL